MKTEFAGNEIEIIMVCNRKNHTKKAIEYIYLEIYAYIGFISGKGSHHGESFYVCNINPP